jgi:hypothetical protein
MKGSDVFQDAPLFYGFNRALDTAAVMMDVEHEAFPPSHGKTG